jgi:toxin FitB
MILLDTNIVSEAFAKQPDSIVRSWYDTQLPADLFLCTPVLAELRHGVELLPVGARRARLEQLVSHIEEEVFLDRILVFDRAAAHEFGRIVARRKRAGRPLMTMDALIAGIAVSHRAMLATRDVSDFEDLGLDVINPFVPHSR